MWLWMHRLAAKAAHGCKACICCAFGIIFVTASHERLPTTSCKLRQRIIHTHESYVCSNPARKIHLFLKRISFESFTFPITSLHKSSLFKNCLARRGGLSLERFVKAHFSPVNRSYMQSFDTRHTPNTSYCVLIVNSTRLLHVQGIEQQAFTGSGHRIRRDVC